MEKYYQEALSLMSFIKDAKPELLRAVIREGSEMGITLEVEVQRLAKYLETKASHCGCKKIQS